MWPEPVSRFPDSFWLSLMHFQPLSPTSTCSLADTYWICMCHLSSAASYFLDNLDGPSDVNCSTVWWACFQFDTTAFLSTDTSGRETNKKEFYFWHAFIVFTCRCTRFSTGFPRSAKVVQYLRYLPQVYGSRNCYVQSQSVDDACKGRFFLHFLITKRHPLLCFIRVEHNPVLYKCHRLLLKKKPWSQVIFV